MEEIIKTELEEDEHLKNQIQQHYNKEVEELENEYNLQILGLFGDTYYNNLEILPPLESFRLAVPFQQDHSMRNHLVEQELSYDKQALNDLWNHAVHHSNTEQKAVINEVIKALEAQTPAQIMMDAPGGTGKTFVLNAILAYARGAKGHICLAACSTGIGAELLDTVHKKFGISVMNLLHDVQI